MQKFPSSLQGRRHLRDKSSPRSLVPDRRRARDWGRVATTTIGACADSRRGARASPRAAMLERLEVGKPTTGPAAHSVVDDDAESLRSGEGSARRERLPRYAVRQATARLPSTT